MIKETMIELLVLSNILKYPIIDKIEFKGNNYNLGKIVDRYNSLMEEFLEPYVIDKPRKSD